MSSHREAPEISKDPVADSADLYAFVSPDHPDTVTLIATYVPSQGPAGGPNFYAFGDDVLYQIHIDNNGDGEAEITYQFRFHDEVQIPTTFLYNIGPIQSINSPNWNRRQFYSVTRIRHDRGRSEELGSHLACPPCNIGPLSTPDYKTLADQAVHELPDGHVVYAGQRADPFYVDLGSIFDLADLRPLANLHATFGLPALPASNGVSTNKLLNVHAICLQIPKRELTVDRWDPDDHADQRAIIGVWTSASRQKVRILGDSQSGEEVNTGPFVQVSRLGNPLFNEVLIPLARKDYWNTQRPADDKQFVSHVEHPELAGLLPVLYPPSIGFAGFPHLAALNATGKPRADLVAILLTGLPPTIIPGFQNFTGPTPADLLRLNTAIKPSASPNNLGLLGSDLAGYPNGRRVFDDIVNIELRAIAGATYSLIDPTFKPDAAVTAITQGLTTDPSDLSAKGTQHYLTAFPYAGLPHSGFDVPAA